MYRLIVKITGSDYNSSERLLFYNEKTLRFKAVIRRHGYDAPLVLKAHSIIGLNKFLDKLEWEFYGDTDDSNNISFQTASFLNIIRNFTQAELLKMFKRHLIITLQEYPQEV